MIEHVLTGCAIDAADQEFADGKTGKRLVIAVLDHQANVTETFVYPMEQELAKTIGAKLMGLPGDIVVATQMPPGSQNGRGRGDRH